MGGRLTKFFWQRASWIWVRLHGELCSNTWERSVWACQGQASAPTNATANAQQTIGQHHGSFGPALCLWSCHGQTCGFPTPYVYQPFACCSSCTPYPVDGRYQHAGPFWHPHFCRFGKAWHVDMFNWPWHAAARATWTQTWCLQWLKKVQAREAWWQRPNQSQKLLNATPKGMHHPTNTSATTPNIPAHAK